MIGINRKKTLALVIVSIWIGTGLCWAESSIGWYYISFDNQRQLTHATLDHPQISQPIETSTGDGDGWYYYPASDRYFMWFYNGPFSDQHRTEIEVGAFVASVDFSRSVSYDITMGWTTPAWTDMSSAPMPGDMPTLSAESNLLAETSVASGSGIIIGEGTIENIKQFTADNYNPTWLFVSVSGRNLMLFRWLKYQTFLKEGGIPGGDPGGDPGSDPGGDPGGDPGNTPPSVSGACCNTAAGGQCYITDNRACLPGFTYQGDGSTCSTCGPSNAQWDLGDAPASYGVFRAHNGALHTLVPGIHLGMGSSGELDGQPDAAATADTLDDGISFLGVLAQNQTAQIRVTASTLGFINAWLDVNRDGDWDDPGEQILGDQFLNPGQNLLSFPIPADAQPGETYMRFRFNTAGGLWHSGPAPDGEVEDYRVTIQAEIQPPMDLAPITPSVQLMSLWRQPAQIDTSQQVGLIDGVPINTSWTQGPLLVDDWIATGPQPLQGFRWWGSFDGWTVSGMPTLPPVAFHVSIWSDRQGLGRPDLLLWEKTLTSWVWAYSGEIHAEVGQTENDAAFEFIAMLSQDQWFMPDDSPHTRYWIGFSALYDETLPVSHPWAWLARRPHQLEDAVILTHVGPWDTGIPSPWPAAVGEMVLGTQKLGDGWDMSFELITQQALDQ